MSRDFVGRLKKEALILQSTWPKDCSGCLVFQRHHKSLIPYKIDTLPALHNQRLTEFASGSITMEVLTESRSRMTSIPLRGRGANLRPRW